ncbi:MAG TPA: hypothetical protein VK587_15110, partial [bacterium]|nr:hypothetical protein [bacterium]
QSMSYMSAQIDLPVTCALGLVSGVLLFDARFFPSFYRDHGAMHGDCSQSRRLRGDTRWWADNIVS